jgi:nucleoside-diphosphate-sugar epimerase
MRGEGLEGGVFNLGSGEETKIIDLANEVLAMSRSKSKISFLPFPAGDHERRLPDTVKAREVLGWCPSVGLRLGLERTYK